MAFIPDGTVTCFLGSGSEKRMLTSRKERVNTDQAPILNNFLTVYIYCLFIVCWLLCRTQNQPLFLVAATDIDIDIIKQKKNEFIQRVLHNSLKLQEA